MRGSAIRDLHVQDGNGPVVQAGSEYRVSRHMAVFAGSKKIWTAVDADGVTDASTGRPPAHARLALDPVIINGGVSWHF